MRTDTLEVATASLRAFYERQIDPVSQVTMEIAMLLTEVLVGYFMFLNYEGMIPSVSLTLFLTFLYYQSTTGADFTLGSMNGPKVHFVG